MANLDFTLKWIKRNKKLEEHFNSIRANIQFFDSNIQTIVLTSVQPNEGKSTVSMHLAASFAYAGFRTLLIDADIRNSVILGTVKTNSPVKGLTEYLSGNVELSEILCESSFENLMIVLPGRIALNPTNLLQNKKFFNLIETVRENFDYVIIDSPPVGLVIDAAIIAKNCDATILVTEAGIIKRRFIQRAYEQMKQTGAQFLGVIFNKYSSGYGGYGGYGQYGEYEKNVKDKKKQRRLRS